MPTRFEDLLRQYERELGINHLLREEFARDFPQLAGALGAAGAAADLDPHVQRLLQGVALMNARTALQLERSQDDIAAALLEQNFPPAVRPFPSCTVVQFERPAMAEGLTEIPRGAELLLSGPDKLPLRFRTARAVTLAPLRLAEVAIHPAAACGAHARIPPGISHLLGLRFEWSGGPLRIGRNAPARLPLFIDADPALNAALRDCLFLRTRAAWVAQGGTWTACPAIPLAPAGFDEAAALLPPDSRAHPAFRLLLEYACFPEQFHFVDLDLAALAALAPSAPGCTLQLGLGGLLEEPDIVRLLAQLGPGHLRPYCSCAVNLFAKSSGPVDYDQLHTAYRLPTDAAHPHCYDIYHIDRVTAVAGGAAQPRCTSFRPLFGLTHGAADAGYWSMARDDTLADLSPGYEHTIALSRPDFEPFIEEDAALSVDLLCTNRDLPHRVEPGAPIELAAAIGDVKPRALRKPSRSYRFRVQDRWLLVSHLTLSRVSLASLDALRELLALHNLPRSAELQRQADGIVALDAKPGRVVWTECGAATAIRGVDLALTLDERAFAGAGVHGFIVLLDHFFGACVHTNSYVQLTVLSRQSGKEIIRCRPRSGTQHLL
jgi:type VI secretion system protein ImpG